MNQGGPSDCIFFEDIDIYLWSPKNNQSIKLHKFHLPDIFVKNCEMILDQKPLTKSLPCQKPWPIYKTLHKIIHATLFVTSL